MNKTAIPRPLASSLERLESRIAPAFGAIVELVALSGADGFQINGEAAGDGSGFSVSAAGDVNGDGFADIIIGAFGADPNGFSSGASYVVFGHGTFPFSVELTSLDGTNGFKINGAAEGDFSGRSVSAAGDINGDRFDDLVIGAPRADANGIDSGASYVVFGRQVFSATLELSGLTGANGFKINGQAAGDHFGRFVSAAGDVNGDLFDDLLIGAPGADPNGVNSGASYVVFGRSTAFSATLEISALTGADGFRINGAAAGDHFGRIVSGARDVNRDNFADLLIGAPDADPNGEQSGAAYVVFGRGTFPAVLEVSALVGTNGFQINGAAAHDHLGRAVSRAGDINGDGFSDLLLGAPGADPNGSASGAAYLLFGAGTPFPSTIEVSALTGTNGFQINGAAAGDRLGRALSAAGDVNGDSIDDLLIGAPFADPHDESSGLSYVIFGKRTPFAGTLELFTLDGTNGFQIHGEFTGDVSGRSVSAAGDLNGDGFADILIGAPGADPNGDLSGASYVIFGQPSNTTGGAAPTNG